MRPELFTIPFLNVSIKSYGTMMVIGFLFGLMIARRLCRRVKTDPEHIANFGPYALIFGVVGARIFHVIHYWPRYENNFAEAFMIWTGGLEFVGGVIGALPVMVIYFRKHKLSVTRYLDMLAPALMLGLAFGRLGCFLNGCCFGAPCDLPWAIRFPAMNSHLERHSGCQASHVSSYSIPFEYQITPDLQRRPGGKPLLQLPSEYFRGYIDNQGNYVDSLRQVLEEDRDKFFRYPIAPEYLTEHQRQKLTDGTYQMVPIHPAQIYSFFSVALISFILYQLAVRYYKFNGQLFALMLILYGIARFILEALRNSSPLEFNGLTISQNMSILSFIVGVGMILYLRRFPHKPDEIPSSNQKTV